MMHRWAGAAALCLMLCLAAGASAQDAGFTPPVVMTFRDAVVFGGPGIANEQIGTLYADQPVQLVERNTAGTWVHIRQINDAGALLREGWILSGYLAGRSALRFSEVPVSSVPDNNPDWSPTFAARELFALPYIPSISPQMLEVYRRGQALGNNPNAISKVGDSLAAASEYLTPMSSPMRALNAFDDLNAVVDQYGPSMAGGSAAASIGLSSFAVFDPMWADPGRGCQPGETPLACEYRIRRPIAAFIMFGPNDVRAMTDTGFGTQMRLIVQQTLDQGIIPVLNLFSVHPADPYAAQAMGFNRQLIAIAGEYQVPLINLWAAAQVLPNYGLDVDNIHLTFSGYDYLYYDAGNEAYSGVALHNLLSLRTLQAIGNAVRAAGLVPESTPTMEATT
jgi:hypothetical protein